MSAQHKVQVDPLLMGRVGVKLFLAICDDWNLTDDQKLVLAGASSKTTLSQWRKKVAAKEGIKLGADTLERLSYVAGIRKGIELLSPKDQWSTYIRKPNRDLGGMSALDRMLAGKVVDLADVRRYLDGLRGAHFV